MRKRRSRLLTGVVAAVLLATACGEAGQPFAPQPTLQKSDRSAQLLGGLIGGVVSTLTNLLFPPVKRMTPLAEDVVWSFTAGPGGATSSNSAVGLKIVVPSGALATTQTITVTALAGSAIAYRFEPHLEFARNVVLTQSLKGTNAGLLTTLGAGHFEGDNPDYSDDGLVKVLELVPALTNLFSNSASFNVKHFSGWIVVSGCKGDDF